MTNTSNTYENASLDQFHSETGSGTDGDSKRKPSLSVAESATPAGKSFDMSVFTDSGVRAFVKQHDVDMIRDLVSGLLDEKHILSAVAEVTSDETLAANIETVMDHYAERPSLVDATADQIADALGMRPFTVSVTEPENEYQKPMISLTVEDDVVLTNNPSVNAELVSYATRIDGVTKSGQERVFDRWRDAVGGELIAAFKADRDPDALGFALPSQIPATGDRDCRTPVTEIPYIGPATAEDLHPCGDLLSITDLVSLTEKQWPWIEFPIESRELGLERVRGISRGLVEHGGENASTLLGHALGMKDRRDSDGEMDWVNPANTFGITTSDVLFDEAVVDSVSETDSGEYVETVSSAGESMFDPAFWELLNSIADAGETSVFAGDETPAFVALPDGGYMIAAPVDPDQ